MKCLKVRLKQMQVRYLSYKENETSLLHFNCLMLVYLGKESFHNILLLIFQEHCFHPDNIEN